MKSDKFSSCGRKTVFLPPWFKQHFESFLLCLPEISVHFWKIWIINTLHKSRVKSRVLVHLTAEQWSAAWLSEWPSLRTRGAAGQNGCPYTVASRVPQRSSGGHVTAVASGPCVCFWSSFSDIWVLIMGDKDIFKKSLDRFYSCNYF